MATRRALIRASDLRTLARVAKDEGVAFNCHVDPLGGIAFTIEPFVNASVGRDGDDLDERLSRFARK